MLNALERLHLSLTIAFAASVSGVTVAQVPIQDQRPVDAALRPAVIGTEAGISTGHPLTTAAAMKILLQGGNAFDAGAAALLTGGVLEQDLYSLGGEALVLVYPRSEGEVVSVIGQGWAPQAADIEWYRSRGKTLEGHGLDPAVVPGAVHAALTVLERWGTMSFEAVSASALEYAENGFPLRPSTAAAIRRESEFIARWPSNQRYWLKPDGSFYDAGDTLKLPTLAATLRRMVEAERAAAGRGRQAGIVAARERFYAGDIAGEMVAFLEDHGTPFALADFAEFFARIEAPAQTTYRDYTVYKHGFVSQGPALLQMLNILENFDLRAMGYGSADYFHTIAEAMKLAFADRDSYYADTAFVDVPGRGLLSKAYAADRAALIDPNRASTAYIAGNPLPFDPDVQRWDFWRVDLADATAAAGAPESDRLMASLGRDAAGISKDTTHIAIVDRDGNVFDATPSGGWIGGSVILGDTGIGLSVRGEQFWLDETRANQLRPRARPRYSLTPSIVFKDGEPFMAIGTPGGDNQEQTIVQAFLSIVEFWDDWYPNLHAAIERPRVQTSHFFGSFWPHSAGFNRLGVEAAVADTVYDELRARGHAMERLPTFGMSGCATVVLIDPATGNRIAGADPRRDCYAIAY